LRNEDRRLRRQRDAIAARNLDRFDFAGEWDVAAFVHLCFCALKVAQSSGVTSKDCPSFWLQFAAQLRHSIREETAARHPGLPCIPQLPLLMKKLCLLPVLAGFSIASATASAETIFALDISNRILRFDSATPGAITFLNGGLAIPGLASGETLLGIDFRPVATNSPAAAFNGVLYGLGATNLLYTIDTTTGAATQVGTPGKFTLLGNAFGVDFNPVPDRLRVVSEQDQSLRLNPNDGTLAATDTALAYATGDSGFGVNPNVVGAAYSNNFGGATVATLYGIDSGRDVLVRVGGVNGTPSPNGGQLTTIGSLGANTIDEVGFDISGSGVAYASLSTRIGPLDTSSDLYTIDLGTGAATFVGSIGQFGGPGAFITRDIAAPVGTPVPEPGAPGLVALGLAVLAGRKVRRAA
jgi:hypothetical protein